MATNLTDKEQEILASVERLLNQKANLLGSDGYLYSEPFASDRNVLLTKTLTSTPKGGSLVAPDYSDNPVQGTIGTRHQATRLHTYLPSGKKGPQSELGFIV